MSAGTLEPIPAGVAIVDQAGSISDFFRLRWQQLIDGFQFSPSVAAVARITQTAAIGTTAAYTTISAGRYRVSYAMHKTIADGVASSLTMTLGWLRNGIALSQAGAALVLDTTAAQQSGAVLVRADAASDLTYAVAYTSNTPNKMTYEVDVTVEYLP